MSFASRKPAVIRCTEVQSRRQSAIEVVTNTFAGMVGSWLIAYSTLVFVEDRVLAATITVVGCTIWSLARGYWIRRRFARLEAV